MAQGFVAVMDSALVAVGFVALSASAVAFSTGWHQVVQAVVAASIDFY